MQNAVERNADPSPETERSRSLNPQTEPRSAADSLAHAPETRMCRQGDGGWGKQTGSMPRAEVVGCGASEKGASDAEGAG